MTRYAKGSKDLNTGVLVRTRNTLASFILLLVVHYLAAFMLTRSYFTLENDMTFIAIHTVAFLYPSISPFYLDSEEPETETDFCESAKAN